MGREVRKFGMQFAAEGFDELSGRIFQIRHQRIANRLHTGKKLYRASQTGAGQKQEQQRDLKEAGRRVSIARERPLSSFII